MSDLDLGFYSFIILFFFSLVAVYLHVSDLNSVKRTYFIYQTNFWSYLDALLFLKTNKLNQKPRGNLLLLQSFWSIFMFFLIGLCCISIIYQVTYGQNLTLATFLKSTDGQSSFASSNPIEHDNFRMCIEKCLIPESTADDYMNNKKDTPQRNVAGIVKNINQNEVNTSSLSYLLINIYMMFIITTFLHFMSYKTNYGSKWKYCNERYLTLKGCSFSSNEYKKFAHDLIITGMWGHRSFRSVFDKILDTIIEDDHLKKTKVISFKEIVSILEK